MDRIIVTTPFPDHIREFVETTPWRFAKTYAATWPHEYVVRTEENAPLILAVARHIFEHGVDGRFYKQIRKYHHEGGKVYWCMDDKPEAVTLVNRCDEGQTYENRLAAGTLPSGRRQVVALCSGACLPIPDETGQIGDPSRTDRPVRPRW